MGRAGGPGEVRLPRPEDADRARHAAVELLRRRGIDLDLARHPARRRQDLRRMLARAETVGVFQVESQGMRRALLDMRPDRFEDIIALVALYRPGPMANIPTYCARKHGHGAARIHPSEARADPARDLRRDRLPGAGDAGARRCSPAIRSARPTCCAAPWARRSAARWQAQRERFVSGASSAASSRPRPSAIFELLERFADYGFNKSHAAAYALVAYQTAYMKANYPVEFLAASMTLDMGNTDKLAEFRAEAERLGIKVEPPSINRSGVAFEVERQHHPLRAGGAEGRRPRRRSRRSSRRAASSRSPTLPISPAASIRARSTSACWRASAAAGAFDALEANRARVFAAVDTMLAAAQRTPRGRGGRPVGAVRRRAATRRADAAGGAEPWLPAERLQKEFDAIGFFLTGHPLDDYARRAQAACACSPGPNSARAVKRGRRAPAASPARWWRAPSGAPRPAARWASSGSPIRPATMRRCVFSEGLAQFRDLLEPGARGAADALRRGAGRRRARPHPDRSSRSMQAAAKLQKGLRVFLRDEAPIESVAKRLEPMPAGPRKPGRPGRRRGLRWS